ncbi:hypothetical protein [uncultured Sphingorhabdus sp.]|jgi:hypothetical protein|uniref:hypothetical protein n=1 Tax=uncultured Sphingorhabdus sp. TaxID=1686106 RepID=UPI0026275FF0|nr:hypothetical protein [uncultured Sphingorhabdus sp.]
MAANEAEIARSDPVLDFFIFGPLPCSKEFGARNAATYAKTWPAKAQFLFIF